MELGLSLGDASKTVEFSREGKSTDQDQKPTKMSGLDFCMALGLSRSSPDNEIDDLQLNLLPINPVRPIKSHLQSLPWSSDNGSSENGSSTAAAAAARVLDVNRPPLAAEEVSSTNSVGSPPLIHMDIGIMYRSDYSVCRGSNKRSLSTDFNNAVEDDEDEENGINARSKKLRLSKQQSAFLEQSFKEQSTLNPKQKLALAKQLNLRPRQVEVWFQNRRARTKLKQTEVDCEYLKRCCETLTEENRRLHKELQELRALKTSDPFHMQLPATTLTMCPSCERVNTASTDTVPFPQTRPRVYPFSKASTHSPS